MENLITPETLQIAGLAIVSLALIGLILKLVILFTKALDGLNNTLDNHFVSLHSLLTEVKTLIKEHRKTEK